MTLTPAGAHLVDLPPPLPHQDPREPAPSSRRGTRTPQRPRSPAASQPTSRGASPQRQASNDRSTSSSSPNTEPVPPLPLHAPLPLRASVSGSKLGNISPGLSGFESGSPPVSGGTGSTGGGIPSPFLGSTTSPASGHHQPQSMNAAAIGHHLSRPSSPSSIHSSTSAIFERDIEHPPIGNLSLSTASSAPGQTLTHKPSRLGFAHGSALDHTVPAVLDDAVEALAGTSRGIEGLEIEAPAPGIGGLGMGTAMARQSSASLAGVGSRKVSMQGMHGHHSGSNVPGVGSASAGGTGTTLSRSDSPISVASGRSSVASPAQSPPILTQLGTQQRAANIGGVGTAGGPGGSSSGAVSPLEGKFFPAANSGPAGTAVDEHATPIASAIPQRPSAPQRMSTGKQLPGGWLSSWTREAEETAAANEQQSNQGETVPKIPSSLSQSTTATAPLPVPSANTSQSISNAAGSISPSTSPGPTQTHHSPIPGSSPTPQSAVPSHLTPQKDKRRISFISPNDLLLSVPTTVTSLGEITSGNLSPEHLPGTVSPNLSTLSVTSGGGPGTGFPGARSPSLGGMQSMDSIPQSTSPGSGSGGDGLSGGLSWAGLPHKTSWDASMSGSGMANRSGLGLGDGEWGREGLGKGLEQRLEDLAHGET